MYDQMIALFHASLPESTALANQVFNKVGAALKILEKSLPKVAPPPADARVSRKNSQAVKARVLAVARLRACATEVTSGVEETDVKSKMIAAETCLVKLKAALHGFVVAWSLQVKQGEASRDSMNYYAFPKTCAVPVGTNN